MTFLRVLSLLALLHLQVHYEDQTCPFEEELVIEEDSNEQPDLEFRLELAERNITDMAAKLAYLERHVRLQELQINQLKDVFSRIQNMEISIRDSKTVFSTSNDSSSKVYLNECCRTSRFLKMIIQMVLIQPSNLTKDLSAKRCFAIGMFSTNSSCFYLSSKPTPN